MVTLKESLITKGNIKNAMTNDNYFVACISMTKATDDEDILDYLSKYYVCQMGISKRTACYVIDERNLINFMRKYKYYDNISILKPMVGTLPKDEVIKLVQGNKNCNISYFVQKI